MMVHLGEIRGCAAKLDGVRLRNRFFKVDIAITNESTIPDFGSGILDPIVEPFLQSRLALEKLMDV